MDIPPEMEILPECGDCQVRHPGSGRDCPNYERSEEPPFYRESPDGEVGSWTPGWPPNLKDEPFDPHRTMKSWRKEEVPDNRDDSWPDPKKGRFSFPMEEGQARLGDVVKAEQERLRTLPVKWADKAMFQAEPIDSSEGPKVYLLWMTPDPLGAIAAACKMYKGEVVRNLDTVTDAERIEYFEQVQKTRLKAPFEFVQFHFMIEGVTRAFTHQMVRQRTAAYAQESLRFAVPTGDDRNLPVRLPPSLSGTDGWHKMTPNNLLSREEQMRIKWESCLDFIDETYSDLIEMGMPAEDARGLLPTNVLTRLHYTTNLRALLDHAGNRLCTQAQFEWRLVFSQIIDAIRSSSTDQYDLPYPNGFHYMAIKLADLFRPVCYQTGRCEFKANFDRACSIRDRVDANEGEGRPSSEWGEDFLCHPEGTCDHPEVEIEAIKPGEWLLDPGAARKKR